jgi:putative DNA methylase
MEVLQFTGYGQSEAFYRVAQAVAQTLPKEAKEKQLLDGFLAGRNRIVDQIRRESTSDRKRQGDLFE